MSKYLGGKNGGQNGQNISEQNQWEKDQCAKIPAVFDKPYQDCVRFPLRLDSN